jgi:hypothetical protein
MFFEQPTLSVIILVGFFLPMAALVFFFERTARRIVVDYLVRFLGCVPSED